MTVRALLVEDDATIADFVARGLREAGFAVDHAADGDAGLDARAGAALRRRDRRRDAAQARRPVGHRRAAPARHRRRRC